MRVITLNDDYDPSDAVCRIRFALDARAFAALVGGERFVTSVSVWNLAADRETHNDWTGAGSGLDEYADPAVSPDLTRIAYHAHQDTAGVDYVVVATVGGGPTRELYGDSEDLSVCGFGFTPDGATLLVAVVGEDGAEVARHDVATLFGDSRQAVTFAGDKPIPLGEDADPTCLACDPGGAVLAVGSVGAVNLFDLESGELIRRLKLRPPKGKRKGPAVDGLAFSPDGRLLAVRANGGVTVWDVTPNGTGKPLAELAGKKPLADVGWSPDGRTLATAGADGTIVFWSADGFAEAARFQWKVGPLTAVAFAPDGLTCAAGAAFGRVVWWDVG